MDHAILRDPRLLAELYARLDGSNDPGTLLAREVARYYGLLARELATVQLGRIEAEVLHVAVPGAERARVDEPRRAVAGGGTAAGRESPVAGGPGARGLSWYTAGERCAGDSRLRIGHSREHRLRVCPMPSP